MLYEVITIVFHGNPLDALVYFKSHNQLINAEDGECPTCGNVNPEQLLQILESKKVDEAGYRITSYNVCYTKLLRNTKTAIGLVAEQPGIVVADNAHIEKSKVHHPKAQDVVR